MKKIYGYIRVSTKKQGDGVSLEVQKADIIRFAQIKNLQIVHWFEELKSASKGFRPQFNHMIEQLYNKEADGFVAHKIDRMMRNRHDWAIINELIDSGCEVLSADGTTLDDVNGRFMGDIQAAVATRYSSNLAQEAKKGLYGRLKQGYYPFHAPLGYIDQGAGKTKTIDPAKAPLVKQLFELYTNKRHTLRSLVPEMYKLGLSNSRGNKLSKNSIAGILKNPFYTGIMQVKGEQFKGNHKPLITMRVFKKAQYVMANKCNTKLRKHDFLFRKMLDCKHCNNKLIGELQKGKVYYRCHTKDCPGKSMQESTINNYICNMLKTVHISTVESQSMKHMLFDIQDAWISQQKELSQSISIRLGSLDQRLERITELLIDGTLDRLQYDSEKQKILANQQELNEQQNLVSSKKMQFLNKMDEFLELAQKPYLLYDLANSEEKRELLEIMTSNFQIDGKSVVFSMVSPFYELANRDILSFGGANQTTTRTIIYSDKNTSPIIPKPLDNERLKEFFAFLLEEVASLPDLSFLNTYEL